MRALRNKKTGEWLSNITSMGRILTDKVPKLLTNPDRLGTVKDVEDVENEYRNPNKYIDLSEYELVEIEIVVTKVIDENNLLQILLR